MSGVTIWPDGRKFALCLTHDVDRVEKSWWHCAYYVLRTGNLYHLKSLFTRGIDRPYWNFEKIMALEKKHGVRSTFFFLNETKKFELLNFKTYMLGLGRYNLHDQGIVEIIKQLDEGGWEVGVHGSYDSYANRDLLADEKKALESITGKPVLGVRQHYLRLSVPETWRIQRDVGFMYDTSFGFRDRVSFRDGKFLPFKPLKDYFMVIPLAIMDGPLFDSSTDTGEAWRTCKEMIEQAERRGAVLTVLWHNNRFNEAEWPGQMRIYERIIEECKERGAWIARCCDISERYMK
jgi:peptidoglycan/xylan/chitin deacetylase (PgdA/CDA1 family)